MNEQDHEIVDGLRRCVLKALPVAAAASVIPGGGTCAADKPAGTAPTEPAKYNLRFAHENARNHPVGRAAVYIADRVRELTNGQCKIQIIDSGAMGSPEAALEAVQLGSLEMASATIGTMANIVPEFDIISLPFLFRDYQHMEKVFRGPLGELLKSAAAKKQFEVLALTTSGSRQLFSRKQVDAAGQMKGLKIRVLEVPILLAAWKTLGAVPTPVAAPELYMALQTGVVDAAETSFEAWVNSSDNEVAPFGLRLNYADSGRVFVLGEMMAKTLPPDVLLAIKRAWSEGQERIFTDYMIGEARSIAEAVNSGAKIVEPDLETFRGPMKVIYEKFKPTIGEAWIKRIQETM